MYVVNGEAEIHTRHIRHLNLSEYTCRSRDGKRGGKGNGTTGWIHCSRHHDFLSFGVAYIRR